MRVVFFAAFVPYTCVRMSLLLAVADPTVVTPTDVSNGDPWHHLWCAERAQVCTRKMPRL